jgi:hypothetical protein
MEFTSPHELLVYLVEFSNNRERNWKLRVGRDLLDACIEDGR